MTNPRLESSLGAQVDRIARTEQARAARPLLRDAHITLSHGSGGKASHQLLDAVILPALANPLLDGSADAAILSPDGDFANGARLALTTDSYVVSPLFFPGGDIGRLAVHGTINDLAMAGARPICLSLGLIIEEGLDMEVLRAVLSSIGAAAAEAGVPVATGDTKVVHRGKADRLFINTAGIGVVAPGVELAPKHARPGDAVLLSGVIGDHGMAVMLAREALEIEAAIVSDSAALHELAAALLTAVPATRVLKDPTRGGVATALNEIARAAGVGVAIDEERVPVRDAVRGACEILGLDVLHIANEGKLLAVVPQEHAAVALATLRAHPLGRDAVRIGSIEAEPAGMVLLRTGIGGARVLDMLVGDPLPRIC
ncbi:hydrogenase expression/formation protein HypE [soil metagenome]